MTEQVRVRFAPSPTGYLHVGGARTALYNWLYARAVGGKFILRIEDTDQARSTEQALREQISDLKWLGLNWDEGPDVGGPYGPYKQSERLEIYRQHAERLLKEEKAFHCFCSDEVLEQKREAAIKSGGSPHYDGTCRRLSPEERHRRLSSGEKAVIRFIVPPKPNYVLQDIIRGEVTFPSDMVGDFVILRSDGMPVYNFCCVVDDALMKITHVLRAEEHLSNSVRQLMLYEAFAFSAPRFGHLSIILGPDGKKLSKRAGATSVNDFRLRGYLPEAMNNFIALLGWSSPKEQEIMSVSEMVEQFSLDRLNSSSAIFDDKKLAWMNSVHLRALSSQDLWTRLQPFLNEAGLEFSKEDEWVDRAVTAFKASMETLVDAAALFQFLADNKHELTPEGSQMAKASANVIEAWRDELKLKTGPYLTEGEFDELQEKVKLKCGVNGKNLFQPIRVAVVGRPQGIEVKKLVPLLSRDSLITRAEKALKGS